MNALQILASIFILLFCDFHVDVVRSLDTNRLDPEVKQLSVEGETDTGNISPYLVLAQTMAMFEKTTAEMDRTVQINNEVLKEVQNLLGQIKTNFSCCCSDDQKSHEVGTATKKEVDNIEQQNISITTPKSDLTEIAPGIQIARDDKEHNKLKEEPTKPPLTDLQKLIRSVLINLKQNFTLEGRIAEIDRDILGN